jgi:hypothetical protein
MADNPLNLALRFVLELIALFALGFWGWTQISGPLRLVATIGLPVIAAALWGIFRAEEPNPPRHTTIRVPGIVRLALELAFFGAATWAFYAAGRPSWGLVFGVTVVAHYLVSYDRISRLLKQS